MHTWYKSNVLNYVMRGSIETENMRNEIIKIISCIKELLLFLYFRAITRVFNVRSNHGYREDTIASQILFMSIVNSTIPPFVNVRKRKGAPAGVIPFVPP